MIHINNITELNELLKANSSTLVLLYKPESEQSKCAYENLTNADFPKETAIFAVNLLEVRDIHTHYGITTLPTLLVFKDSSLKNIVKGCNSSKFYESLFTKSPVIPKGKKSKKASKTIIVYSTPSCSWCTKLKNYLKKHNVKFREVNVAKNAQAAFDLQKRSGQVGVPQTEINGKIIVGFDKVKINKMLGIK